MTGNVVRHIPNPKSRERIFLLDKMDYMDA